MEIAALIVSIVAIVVSILTWRITERITAYASLDELTMQLMRVGLEHPAFRDCSFTSDYKNCFKGQDLKAYECYAAMAWNICETIFDRCRKNKWLRNAWEPQIRDENRLHRAWFDAPGNGDTYNGAFVRYISQRFPREP